jgi:hypothetical protein
VQSYSCCLLKTAQHRELKATYTLLIDNENVSMLKFSLSSIKLDNMEKFP